jgi:hypothetical protein
VTGSAVPSGLVGCWPDMGNRSGHARARGVACRRARLIFNVLRSSAMGRRIHRAGAAGHVRPPLLFRSCSEWQRMASSSPPRQPMASGARRVRSVPLHESACLPSLTVPACLPMLALKASRVHRSLSLSCHIYPSLATSRGCARNSITLYFVLSISACTRSVPNYLPRI